MGNDFEEIYLAGGCFWGTEAFMERVNGVIDVTSGYANGNTENPSYEDVIYNDTDHAETVHVKYDPDVIDLEDILLYYFKTIDPTSVNKQGNNAGSQYRTGIYYVDEEQVDTIEKVIRKEQEEYEKEIVVGVEPLENYYLAEDYHQDYKKKNPATNCGIDLSLAERELEREDTSKKEYSVQVNESLYSRPSEDEIRESLGENQYQITQNKGTENPYSHEYNTLFEKGIYVDVITGEPLFSSEDKYDAGSGWPSFTRPIDPDVVTFEEDNSLGMNRIEVRSRVGYTHLGHIFEDGPVEDGGKRYCMNGAALRFVPYEEMEKEGYEYLINLFK